MPVLSNHRHERFAQALAAGKTSDEAYQAAGYEENRGNATRLKANENVQARVAELQARVADGVVLTRQWVIERLIQNVDRAMQVEEVTRDGAGTGEYRYEGSVANKALELLGKEVGMFKERVEHTGVDGGPIEHRENIASYSDEQLEQLLRSRVGRGVAEKAPRTH